jgi:hypothetical protein
MLGSDPSENSRHTMHVEVLPTLRNPVSEPAVRLSLRTARRRSALALSRRFGRRYTAGGAKLIRCRRVSGARALCRVAWRHAAWRYGGFVRVRRLASGRVVATVVVRRRRPAAKPDHAVAHPVG